MLTGCGIISSLSAGYVRTQTGGDKYLQLVIESRFVVVNTDSLESQTTLFSAFRHDG